MSFSLKKYFYALKVRICYALIFVFCFSSSTVTAQKDFFESSPTYNSSRVVGVTIGETVATAIVSVGLNYLWYKKFPHSRFHFFNDNNNNNKRYNFFIDNNYNHPLVFKKKLNSSELKELESFQSKKYLEQNILGLSVLFKDIPAFYMPLAQASDYIIEVYYLVFLCI